MFKSFLESIPKNRSAIVNELELPADISVTPYVWMETEEPLTPTSSICSSTEDLDLNTMSTDSSIPLSRAMTDSEIDYGRYKRYKARRFSVPWDYMTAAMDAFPPGYLTSLNSFYDSSIDLVDDTSALDLMRREHQLLCLRMAKFFEEECNVFEPDDPSLLSLEEALRHIDLKGIKDDLACAVP